MKQGTMNILFFVLKTKLLKNGEAPILMRITINGQYEEIRIQRSVPLKNWNPAKGCSKGKDRASIELNNYISALTTRAYEKHKELTFESALITPKTILKRVFGKDETVRTLLGTLNTTGNNRQIVSAPVQEPARTPGKTDSPLLAGLGGLLSASSSPADETPDNPGERKKRKKKRHLKL